MAVSSDCITSLIRWQTDTAMMIESVVLLAIEVAGAEAVAVNLGIRKEGRSADADQKAILASNMSVPPSR